MSTADDPTVPLIQRLKVCLTDRIKQSRSLVLRHSRLWSALAALLAVTGWVLAALLWLADPVVEKVEPALAEATAPASPRTVPIGRPYLGIRGEAFSQGNLKGLKVLEVFPGSPAAVSGLRSQNDPLRTTGDLIVRVNDRAIQSEEDFRLLMQESAPGDLLNVLVTSSGADSYEIVPVTLGAAPDSAPVDRIATRQASEVPQKSEPAAQIEAAILSQVNRLRTEHGLAALNTNPLLQQAARSHSEEMARERFFAHIDPKGRDVVDRIRLQGVENFKSAGENIFVGQNLRDLIDSVIRGWMESPGHKRNLLFSGYREVGTGVAVADKQSIYVTQVYLDPL